MRPAFRRGWEGEGKQNRCPGAGQRARSDRHTGVTILLWETRGQSPWRSRQSPNGGDQPPPAATRHKNGTLARRDADGRCDGKQSDDKAVAPPAQRRQSKRTRVRRSHDKQRGKSASGSAGQRVSGSAQKHRTLKERSEKECDPRKTRSYSHAPDRHRNGQDYRLGSRQRIERVAGRQFHHSLAVAFVPFEALTSIVHLIDFWLLCEFARQAASSSRLSLVASMVVAQMRH